MKCTEFLYINKIISSIQSKTAISQIDLIKSNDSAIIQENPVDASNIPGNDWYASDLNPSKAV